MKYLLRLYSKLEAKAKDISLASLDDPYYVNGDSIRVFYVFGNITNKALKSLRAGYQIKKSFLSTSEPMMETILITAANYDAKYAYRFKGVI